MNPGLQARSERHGARIDAAPSTSGARRGPRVLHVITTLSPGGAEHHLLALVRGQVSRGCEARVAYLKGGGELTARFLEAGAVEVRKTALERPRHLPGCVAALRRLMAHVRPDVVHTHLLKANCVAGIAARSLTTRRPVVIASKHNDEHHLRRRLVGLTHGAISRLCDDHVIALSDHVRSFVSRHGRVDSRRISRVYYGFDPEIYPARPRTDIRRELSLPGDAFLFGIVARITEQKGHLDLLEAFARVVERRPATRLLIVGGPGYDLRFLRAVELGVSRLELEDRVIMTGARPDAFSIIGQLDCLVMPSHWEGFGMVFLEALYQGVPVVATIAGAIPEVVRHGIDGLLARPADPASLAETMDEMIERHAVFHKRLEETGRRDVLRRFSVEKMVEETLGVYAKTARG